MRCQQKEVSFLLGAKESVQVFARRDFARWQVFYQQPVKAFLVVRAHAKYFHGDLCKCMVFCGFGDSSCVGQTVLHNMLWCQL